MEEYYLGLLQHDYSQLSVASFALLGAGEDHCAFTVNGDWVFRFARDAEADRDATRDAADLLIFLQKHSPLTVPLPVYRNEAHGYMGYQKLPGVSLLGMREQFTIQGWPTFPQAIGAFLTAIHATPLDQVRAFVHDDPVALEDWREEARTTFALVRRHIPTSSWQQIDAFLLAPVPAEAYVPTLAHSDFGIEHILVDPAMRRITGIIDWGDAAIADPAYDFGKLYRDLGLAALEAVLTHYHPTTNDVGAIRERAIFYGRCTVFEDLAYGLQSGYEAYLRKSLALLDQLFD